ncbi:histone methyltransferase set2, partial [Coemansia sp. RSA 2705]
IPKKAKRDASAAATPAASARHSPSQTAGSSPAPPRWRNSPAPPQSRVRSASPMAPDSDARPHQRPPRHAGVAGWNRRGGFAASQPPYPGQRHRSAQHVPRSRSRSPQGPRRSAGPYGPSGQHGLHARQQQQQRMPGGDRPYAMAAGSEGGRRPYADSRPDAARYSDPRTADAPVLAPGWRTAFTKDQVPYYYHESTKETQWEPPLAEPASRRGADGGAAGHFAQRRPDARDPRVYSATPADGPRARVDDIVDRAKRMGVQTPEQRQPQQPPPAGTVQLVTPETDGEPPAAGPANGLAASTQAARSAAPSSSSNSSSSSANSSAGARRSSPDSGALPPAAKRERLEKKAASELASFVVRAMNRYKAQMSHDEFKHEARKLSKILLEKERRGGAFDPQKLVELSAHKRAKIKQFVADYMGKLLARQSESNQ